MSFNIIGTGSCLPQLTVTNDDLSKILETSDEWITSRTGIKERRICVSETADELAIEAAKRALENSGTDPKDIDLIICSTATPAYATPSVACLVSDALGTNCGAFDINAACSGFLYALNIANSYFKAGTVNKILVISAEQMSRALDWTDRSTCVLFGDGAGAVVLNKGDGLIYTEVNCIPNKEYIYINNCGQKSPYSTVEQSLPKLHMDGGNVMKFAVKAMAEGIMKALDKTGLSIDDIDYILPHQANMRILRSARKLLNVPEEKILSNIDKRANISSACIPILIDECNRKNLFKQGDMLAMSAFGAGLTTSSAILKW